MTGGSGAKGTTAPFGQVAHLAGGEIDFEVVPLLDGAGVAGQHRQPDVDRVAKEDARERLGEHRPRTGQLDDARRVLAARAEAEVAPAHHEDRPA